MNYLQKLIELRGLTCQDIATATGYGYHSIQKTVKGVRQHPQIRTAIAEFLDLSPVRTWGRGSVIYLRKQVAIAANKLAQEKAETARQEVLAKYADSATLPANRKAVNV